jgi:signal transduction histidine kinase
METMTSAANEACRRASILIVEDDEATRVALQALLAPLAHRVEAVSSGDDALRCLLDEEFAVVLMDVRMPGLSGLETAALIRQRERTCRTPIIFLTGVNTGPTEILRGYMQGAVDYLLKPYDPDILRSKVAVFVELFAAREQARQLAIEHLRRTQAEAERRRLHHFLTQAPVPICVFRGAAHTFEFANPRFHAIVSRTALIGRRVIDALPFLVGTPVIDILDRAYQTGEPFHAHEFATPLDRNGDGNLEEAFFSFNLEPLRDEDGATTGLMVVAVEVTDQVHARRRAEDAVKSRDTFISVASHELRTPMTTLRMQADVMLIDAQKGELTQEHAVSLLERSRRQLARMERLITELADAERLAAGHLELQVERVDAAQLVREIAERSADEVKKAGSVLSVDAHDAVVGQWDRFRLDQVVTNLLSNALRYGEAQPIEVSAHRVGDHAVIEVQDHGIGISEDAQGRIFERFERATSKSAREGLGLGLWISRRIVEALHGRILVASEPGHGSKFIVEIPLSTA